MDQRKQQEEFLAEFRREAQEHRDAAKARRAAAATSEALKQLRGEKHAALVLWEGGK